jgi:hypothetical protein
VFSKLFWKDALERVISSAAGGALSVLTLSATDTVPIDGKVWWIGVGVPALTSLLKALIAAGKHDTISPASFAAVKPPEQPAEPA